MAADIKSTLSTAISELHFDVQGVAWHLEEVEDVTTPHETAIHQIQVTTTTQTMQLREIHHHLEDLDNRGRRHKLRIRDLPESVEQNQLTPTILTIFNDLLERPQETLINME